MVKKMMNMLNRMQRCVESVRGTIEIMRESGRYKQIINRTAPKDNLRQFLKSTDKGYFIVIGEPGIGKTGFLFNLCTNSTICYFFQWRTQYADLLYFLNYLAAELYIRIEKKSCLPHWLNDPSEAHSRANLLINRIGRDLNEKNPLIIIVDALDEVNLGTDENARLLKFDLPPNVYVIGSSRPDCRILDQLTWYPDVHTFKWKCDEEHTIAEVDRYVKNLIPGKTNESIRFRITNSAKGNILLATLLLNARKEKTLLSYVIKQGSLAFEKLYRYEWEYRILRRTENRDLCEDIATLFAASREPLNLSIIIAGLHHLGNTQVKGYHAKHTLEEMGGYIESFNQDGILYFRPFHPSFFQWLDKFYASHLSDSHRALALTSLEILKNPINKNFEYAARSACWHLRQWAGRTLKKSQQNFLFGWFQEI